MSTRPALGVSSNGSASAADDEPVHAFVRILQEAIDSGSADRFNERFAADVLWGSPFAAVIEGYEAIHAIHARMFGAAPAVPGASTYTVEHVRRLSSDVVLGYVRRTRASAQVPGGGELALFVLAKRDGQWWLAAGQHLPDRRDVYAPRPPATTDLCDAHEDVRVLAAGFRDFGAKRAFCGRARTLRVYEDNALVRAALETAGGGDVLVVDGGGSTRTALVGGNLGKLAQDQGWAGIVVNGAVRDSAELAQCAVGIKALAAVPRKSAKAGAGETAVAVTFGGITVAPGDWVYADEDGVVVGSRALHDLG